MKFTVEKNNLFKSLSHVQSIVEKKNTLPILSNILIEEQNNLRERIIETAEKKKIPFQRLASSRYTGTDTDAFAYSNGGVASALISLPLRYMHTTVEMVHRKDVENVIKLMYETLLTIKEGESFSYFD